VPAPIMRIVGEEEEDIVVRGFLSFFIFSFFSRVCVCLSWGLLLVGWEFWYFSVLFCTFFCRFSFELEGEVNWGNFLVSRISHCSLKRKQSRSSGLVLLSSLLILYCLMSWAGIRKPRFPVSSVLYMQRHEVPT
jgi:hypothetical protein